MSQVITGRGHKLDHAGRVELLEILARFPAATAGQVALEFRHRTGRTVGKSSVWRVRAAGYKFRSGNGHLTPDEHVILAGLIADHAGGCPPAPRLAALFREKTGRAIGNSAVNYVRRQLGVPVPPRGRPRKERSH